ncbi:MAG: CDP-2,3-bis-(O-geranylgeranyl)-sn-glycerol synthase [Methanobrevibacter sp.]|nr:CDP-2,3-bis-(O-geranylgeranyl)-sn-glycerol synthase [Methanobrevibacter sp.]MCL2157368.1 CDP-2,3-bis-(O-geranylgeranyl)-sn-glycerol synthase [Methanobrevibacter sp.]
MNIESTNFLIICFNVIYFILPAYIANLSGLAFGGKTPIDMKKNFFDKRRIIGDGVTWKGFIFGTIAGVLVGIAQGIISGDIFYGFILGFLLAFGALLGDAAGSFIKRRLNVDRGRPAPLLDQLDFIVGALILASFVVKISLTTIVITVIITLILHLLTNIIAYGLGLKDVWY